MSIGLASPISSFRHFVNPINTTKWIFSVEGLAGLTLPSDTLKNEWDNGAMNEKGKHMSFSVQRVSVGTKVISTKNVLVGSDYSIRFPQGETTPDFDVTFVESDDRKVQNFFKNWMGMVKDEASKVYYPPNSYKGIAQLCLFSADIAEPTPIFYIVMEGIFPLAIGNVTVDYRTANPLLLGVKFACDYARFDEKGIAPVASPVLRQPPQLLPPALRQ
jgi:hypothetical protein